MSSEKKEKSKDLKIDKILKEDKETQKIHENIKPKTIEIDNTEYYIANDLKEYDPTYFFGCSKTVRSIIDKKNIDVENYLYANESKLHGWKLVADKENPPPKAQLLLSKNWVQDNVSKFKIIKEDNDDELVDAPPLLILKDSEKFINDNGDVLEIETRGEERLFEKVFFKASDVSIAFNMPNLAGTIMHKEGNYKRNIHYKTFIQPKMLSKHLLSNRKQLYISYHGIIKLLYASKTGTADKFLSWMNKTLFTAQMGTYEQKEELASGLLGLTKDQLKRFLDASATPIPCIYRFALGTVKDLRKSMDIPKDIPDNHIVIKYGRTDSLKRRKGEHDTDYENIDKNCNLELMGFAYVEDEHLIAAEREVREYLQETEIQLHYKKKRELFICDPASEKDINEVYAEISRKYSGIGSKNKYIDEIRDLNAQIMNIKHEKELQYEKHKTQISEFEKIIMQLKYEKELLERNEKELQVKIKRYSEAEGLIQFGHDAKSSKNLKNK